MSTPHIISFQGRLAAFAGDARDNVPFCKVSIKVKEEGSRHPLLETIRDDDEGIDGACRWANAPGYGKASFTLTDRLPMSITFDVFDFKGTLVGISMSKKATNDLGTIVEYSFNFEKDPSDDDCRFWMSYLKQKEDPGTLPVDESGRPPKAKALEFYVVLATVEREESVE